jgi:propanediol dehydratase small subunit
VAEKLEEDYNFELACEFYEEAAKLYEQDGQVSYTN